MKIRITTSAAGADILPCEALVDCRGNRYVVETGDHYSDGALVPVLCEATADIPRAGEKLMWTRAIAGCAMTATIVPFEGLSEEAIQMCKNGHFEEKDLVEFLPSLEREIAMHGEYVVVSRCQVARANCATAGFAIECVKRFYEVDPKARASSEMARKAMTQVECEAARNDMSNAVLGNLMSLGSYGFSPSPPAS